jgi:mannosyltransferase
LLVLFVIITIGTLTAKAWRSADKIQRTNLLLVVAYVIVPIAILTLVSLVKPMYVERYLSHILIAGSMFVGIVVALTLAKKPSRNLIMLCSGLLATMLIGVIQLTQVGNYNFQRLQSPAVKELASTINCDRDTTIFAADPYVAIELDYYLSSCQIRFYSETVSLGGGYAPLSNNTLHVSDPAKELTNSRRVVYVYYDTQKLAMPSALRESSSISYGSLHAATFSAEK